MRSPGFVWLFLTLSGPAYGESLSGIDAFSSPVSDSAHYQLGGAVSRAALPPLDLAVTETSTRRLRASAPHVIRETSETSLQTALGGISIYFGEAWNGGTDVYQFGTALTRGQATAGVSVTYKEDSQDVTASELYLDYAVTERFSVGISGILSDDLTDDADPLPQLGLSAELNTESGTFLQGGFANSQVAEPVFGVAIGFRF